jgi:hypothetical protein
MIFPHIFKSILFLFVFKIICKFIKKYKLKNVYVETIHENDLYGNDLLKNNNSHTEINNYCVDDKVNDSSIVSYKNELNEENKCTVVNEHKKTYNLKEIYNNFFNGIKTNIKNDINPEYLKTNFKKTEKPIEIIKENLYNLIIYNNSNNDLKWTFSAKKDKIYKLKSYLKINSETTIRNVEVKISDNNGNSFIYDYVVYDYCNDYVVYDYCSDNNENKFEKIYNFSFILDNNYFNENDVIVEINFKRSEDINKNKYIFDEVFMEVIEKNIIEETPILIFDVNEKYTPIYFNKNNILDLDELEVKYFE